MKKGFTLIELLVVIAIIGILSSVVLASLNSARVKSRDARRIADLNQISKAMELYYDANGQYPPDNCIYDTSKGCLASLPPTSGSDWAGGTVGVSNIVPNFISKLALDPLNTSSSNFFYYYEAVFAGQTQFGTTCGSTVCAYMLSTSLENTADPRINNSCNGCYPSHNYCIPGGSARLNSSC